MRYLNYVVYSELLFALVPPKRNFVGRGVGPVTAPRVGSRHRRGATWAAANDDPAGPRFCRFWCFLFRGRELDRAARRAGCCLKSVTVEVCRTRRTARGGQRVGGVNENRGVRAAQGSGGRLRKMGARGGAMG